MSCPYGFKRVTSITPVGVAYMRPVRYDDLTPGGCLPRRLRLLAMTGQVPGVSQGIATSAPQGLLAMTEKCNPNPPRPSLRRARRVVPLQILTRYVLNTRRDTTCGVRPIPPTGNLSVRPCPPLFPLTLLRFSWYQITFISFEKSRRYENACTRRQRWTIKKRSTFPRPNSP